MRIRRLLAAFVVLVIVSTTGALSLWQAGAPAGATPVVTQGTKPPHRHRCVIRRQTAPEYALTLQIPAGPTATTVRPLAGGDTGSARAGLVVSIPPVVLIRPRQHWFEVTTNTGMLPHPTDQFWILHGDHASRAEPSLRAEVLATCTAWTPPA